MSDQGVWFKLHCAALDDPDLDNLPVADFGRWAKLGAYTKRHGTGGQLRFSPPARVICSMLQVADFPSLVATMKSLPHVRVECSNERRSLESMNGIHLGNEESGESSVAYVTNRPVTYTLSFDNWWKYQGDLSVHRVRKFREKVRQMKRSKRRGEERRIEEEENKNKKPPSVVSPPTIFRINNLIVAALDRAPRLGAVARLRDPLWWQAEIRANPGVDFAAEVLKAEAWLVSNPTRAPKKDAAAFFHRWLRRADRREEE